MTENFKSIQPIERLRDDIPKYGTKFGIQRLFVDMDMCAVPTQLHTPETSQSRINSSIVDLNRNSEGVTIRFSYKDVL